MEENRITNDQLYNEIAAAVDRIKDHIIEEILLNEEGLLLDGILDQVQEAIRYAEDQKDIYKSWIFKHEIPEKYIFDPGKEEVLEDDDSDGEFEPSDEDLEHTEY